VGIAEQQVDIAPEELQALQAAFAQFSRRTEELRSAYANLQREAERVNVQLEEANRALEQKVRELDELYHFQRSILESIPTAVVVTDLEGSIRAFNPAAEGMWGRSRDEALGMDFRDVMGAHSDLLAGTLAGHYRRETLRRDLGRGESRIISSTACLVEDSSGRAIGAVQLDRDITRLCQLESELSQQEKLAELGTMAAGLAHEIRKPLNGIKGFASLLARRTQADDAQRRYSGCVVEAADRLDRMLHRLLDFARPDALDLRPLDLRLAAEQVAEFVRAEAAGEPVPLEVAIPDEARMVLADADKVKQVLLNLVKNGLEALQGEGRLRIEARLERGPAERAVCASVIDTGRGMEADELDKVLEPFYSRKEGGTGLGLAIVNRLLQLHGTRLDIQSRPGAGTTVSFRLPAAAAGQSR